MIPFWRNIVMLFQTGTCRLATGIDVEAVSVRDLKQGDRYLLRPYDHDQPQWLVTEGKLDPWVIVPDDFVLSVDLSDGHFRLIKRSAVFVYRLR